MFSRQLSLPFRQANKIIFTRTMSGIYSQTVRAGHVQRWKGQAALIAGPAAQVDSRLVGIQGQDFAIRQRCFEVR